MALAMPGRRAATGLLISRTGAVSTRPVLADRTIRAATSCVVLAVAAFAAIVSLVFRTYTAAAAQARA